MDFSEGESAGQFTTHFLKQARHCNFGAALEDNLYDQPIKKERFGFMLETKNTSLEKARAWETLTSQTKGKSSTLVETEI